MDDLFAWMWKLLKTDIFILNYIVEVYIYNLFQLPILLVTMYSPYHILVTVTNIICSLYGKKKQVR